MRWLDLGARACAILAGVLMTAITLMTVLSVLGRNTTGWTIQGDFELVGFATGAAVALFLPWCQVRRGNIIVDFFTARARANTQAWLDRFGALVLALCMGLMAWRTAVGGLNAWDSGSGSMMRGFPEWVVYVFMVPPLALTSVVAAVQAVRGLDVFNRSAA